MHPDTLLSELGTLAGLPELKLNEQGCTRLVFDGSLAVNFEWNDSLGQLLVYAPVGRLPAEGKEPLYRLLLEGNLFGLETAGATLSVDPLENEIVLHRAIEVEGITATAFQALVGAFVDTLENWTARLAELPAPDPKPREESSTSQAPAGMFRV